MGCLDFDTADLAERNGAHLLATQLQSLQREHNASLHRHEEEISGIRAQLTQAEKIGLRALKAQRDGRKTVRLDSLMEGTEV